MYKDGQRLSISAIVVVVGGAKGADAALVDEVVVIGVGVGVGVRAVAGLGFEATFALSFFQRE